MQSYRHNLVFLLYFMKNSYSVLEIFNFFIFKPFHQLGKLTLPALIPVEERKLNNIFIFLWCLKKAPQIRVKMKI